MKVLLIGDADSIHLIKWVRGLANENTEIGLWSLTKPREEIYKEIPGLVTGYPKGIESSRNNFFKKLNYLSTLNNLKGFIKQFEPDILHAHFASSYGLLASLTGFNPLIISVWGTDVFDFPKKSIFHKAILRNNLYRADKILSTSEIMAKEAQQYTSKPIEVTPFGVDLSIFKPCEPANPIFRKEDFVIGTVKTLEEKYGVKYLIQAFSQLKNKHPGISFKLLIVGGGSQETSLKELVIKYGIENSCVFTGKVPFEDVPRYHNMLSVSVNLSICDSESFGVSVVEASACEKAVIVSNVGGLKEVVEDGVSGIIIPAKSPGKAAQAIEDLYFNDERRRIMGHEGRKRVEALYDWSKNLLHMRSIYTKLKV